MVLTPSTMLELNTPAPDFALPDTEGKVRTLSDFSDADVLCVVFMCNHCPYVVHLRDELATFAKTWQERGVAFVGINSNDASTHPGDSPQRMKEEVKQVGYTFPYLYDESQEVAKAYRAACTPDFFVFDKDRRLVYRGQFDASRPGNDESITGADLADALQGALDGDAPRETQLPSMGCNIKWKAGNAPDYFGA